ncbi:MAG: hypothetical protein EHM28_03160 [Spirochaetaceae bacterium]|nr:MAG: hypothetical protein EHM28_03160 [Spirochaetaceae bacterium]
MASKNIRNELDKLSKDRLVAILARLHETDRKASTEASDKEQMMLLMLYAVEQGIEVLRKYGDKNEEFSTGIADMFYHVLESMGRKGLLEKYKKRCSQIAKDAKAGGDDFSSEMIELYDEFFDAG